MEPNTLPKMNMDLSETKCCPKFDPTSWEDQEIVLKDKLFAVLKTRNFMHVPLNMGSVMEKSWEKIQAARADYKDSYLLLSYDPSPWKGLHYMAITKDVPGLDTETISGTFITKVFEGPYKDAGKWVKEMEKFAKSKDKKMKKLYFFYTTCPKCIKHWGENYVVGFAQI